MSNSFLSQEEIDSLLNGVDITPEPSQGEALSDIEKDLLGEIGNISMGSASTALSQIIGHQVNITTPMVEITTVSKLMESFEVPNIALEVKYTSGISGENLLVMKITDAVIIANLMMGGDGRVGAQVLSEIEESAVSEAMNQMIGSAATSMATMFGREVNISPPNSKIWSDPSNTLTDSISLNEKVVQISFKLTISDLVDSTIMQILPMVTAKKIVAIMMGTEAIEPDESPVQHKPIQTNYATPVSKKEHREPVEVHKAAFQPLQESATSAASKNIDLILDVPLEVSVVLGRTKKTIKDILSLGTGSLIELDKLADEPVEILVNGKIVAFGEVVVVDESFGVRITSIVSSVERVKTLSK